MDEVATDFTLEDYRTALVLTPLTAAAHTRMREWQPDAATGPWGGGVELTPRFAHHTLRWLREDGFTIAAYTVPSHVC